MLDADTTPRLHCYRCDKPLATCICAKVQQLSNNTGVTIVQHPRERRHPLGTARLAELGLRDVRVLVDVEGRYRGPTAPTAFPERTAVLYPGAQARPLPDPTSSEAPTHLVVIDGTWHQAKTLYRDMTWLHDFPHYVLSPDAPSRYRIRREPKHDYISTLEALLLALQHLEPCLTGVEQLLGAFDAMIDLQIAHEAAGNNHRQRALRRANEHCRKPRALAEQYPYLVLIYAESIEDDRATRAPTAPRDVPRAPRRLVYFCAHRLRDQAVLERWVETPCAKIPESILAATCATRATPTQIVDAVGLERDLQTFLHSDDAFAAWGPSSLRFLPEVYRRPVGRSVLLKAAFKSIWQGGGALERIIEQGHMPAFPPPVPGRGGERLSQARSVAEFIHRYEPGAASSGQLRSEKHRD